MQCFYRFQPILLRIMTNTTNTESLNLRKYVISEKVNTFHYIMKDLIDDSKHEMKLSGKQAMNFLSAKEGNIVYVKCTPQGEVLHYRLVQNTYNLTRNEFYKKLSS